MSSPYADWTRDGLDKLLKLGRALCATVTTFAHIIRSKYSDKPNILALLTAIEAVCTLMPDALADYDAIPSDDGLPPVDPGTTPGINPGAPSAPDPIIV